MSPSQIWALTVIAGLLYNFTCVNMKRPNKKPLKQKKIFKVTHNVVVKGNKFSNGYHIIAFEGGKNRQMSNFKSW